MICCAVCGSIRVQYAVWYSPNTHETDDVFGSWNAGDNTFCADCDEEGRDCNADLLDENVDPEQFNKLRKAYLAKKKSLAKKPKEKTK